MTERLHRMQEAHPQIGDVRGPGLAIGVELVRDPESREPFDDAFMDRLLWWCVQRGLFFQFAHNVVKLKPPLIISQAEAEKAMDILEEAFDVFL